MEMAVKVVGRENEGDINKDNFVYGAWENDDEKKEFVQYLRLGRYFHTYHDALRRLEVCKNDKEIVGAVIIGQTDNENILRDARNEYIYFFKAKHGRLPSFRK